VAAGRGAARQLPTSMAEHEAEAAETREAAQTALVTLGGRRRKRSGNGNKQANPAQG